MSLRIAIGTDHGGFEKKNEMAAALAAMGHAVADCGTFTAESTDYPIYASRVAKAVSNGAADFGIIICKTGNGMSMAANRFRGVRAALAVSPETARLARGHNDANVLVVGCDHTPHDPIELAKAFLAAPFEGGRHKRRVDMLSDFDEWADSPLATVRALRMGHAIWLDHSAPGSFTKSVLEQRASHEGLRGVAVSAHERDVRDASEALMPVFRATGGDEGFVVLPSGAAGAAAGVANAMATVAFSRAALGEVRRLVAADASVCVRGIVAVADFDAVAQAVIAGHEDAIAAGKPARAARVVASVEVARIDAAANARIEEAAAAHPERAARLRRLRDRAALAHCQRLQARLMKTFFGEPFARCARAGASAMRLLWTGTTPPAGMSPVYYVNELVAPCTASLVSPALWEAMESGATIVRDRLVEKTGEDDELRELAAEGVDFDKLLDEIASH